MEKRPLCTLRLQTPQHPNPQHSAPQDCPLISPRHTLHQTHIPSLPCSMHTCTNCCAWDLIGSSFECQRTLFGWKLAPQRIILFLMSQYKAKTISKKCKATNDNVASGIAKKRKSMSNGKENEIVNDKGKGKAREGEGRNVIGLPRALDYSNTPHINSVHKYNLILNSFGQRCDCYV